MSCVIDLSQWRHASQSLSHPAGVTLPLDRPDVSDLLIPQVRKAIASGRHCADLISALPTAVPAGTRALVIDSGLGIISTLVANIPGVGRLIVIEPNIAIADYIGHVHEANGARSVEILNGIPVDGDRGRIPLFARHDVRASSLVPDDGPWRQVMLVPGVDLGLILGEEQISLVVAQDGAGLAPILVNTDLASVDRMVLGATDMVAGSDESEALASLLPAAGFKAERAGAAMMFGRANLNQGWPERHAASF